MEVKIKTTEGLVDDTIETVDGVMIVSPKEQFKYTDFKDGDVIVCGWSDSEWICILKGEVDTIGSINYFIEDYCGMYFKGQGSDKEVWVEPSYSDSATFIRPATEKEKQKLFDKLAEAGYEFDFEKKELVKLKWKPKVNKVYYYPSMKPHQGIVISYPKKERNTELPFDKEIIDAGWVFKTEKECQAFCDKLNKVINSVKP